MQQDADACGGLTNRQRVQKSMTPVYTEVRTYVSSKKRHCSPRATLTPTQMSNRVSPHKSSQQHQNTEKKNCKNRLTWKHARMRRHAPKSAQRKQSNLSSLAAICK